MACVELKIEKNRENERERELGLENKLGNEDFLAS